MKRFLITTMVALLVFTGCDKQRDLYVAVDPQIQAVGDWMPSLGRADMTMDATAVAYDASGMAAKEYFFSPRTATLAVGMGTYDVMIFNGLMYAPDDTHLDDVYFRGTDRLDSFEAVAAEGTPSKRLFRAEGEYIASNKMEIVTSAVQRQKIDAGRTYHLKYEDGKSSDNLSDDNVPTDIEMVPVAMSYEAQVVVNVTNISSAYGADAAIYGLVGSAFMASRRPSHFYVTHQFNLNNKKILDADDDIGTIESPVFVTFGPPVDAPDRKYEVYVKVTLVDGQVVEETFDVTSQMASLIEEIRDGLEGTGPVLHMLDLSLAVNITLPKVDPIEGGIGIDDWGDDEIITVPIPKK